MSTLEQLTNATKRTNKYKRKESTVFHLIFFGKKEKSGTKNRKLDCAVKRKKKIFFLLNDSEKDVN